MDFRCPTRSLPEIHAERLRAFESNSARQYAETANQLEDHLRLHPRDHNSWIRLADLHASRYNYREAYRVLHNGFVACDGALPLLHRLLGICQDCGLTEDAMAIASEAVRLQPGKLLPRLWLGLFLPALFTSEVESRAALGRFQEQLAAISQSLLLDTSAAIADALQAVASFNPFYLGYQGADVTQCIAQYSRLVARITAAAYPDFKFEPNGNTPNPKAKLRVGFLSRNFWAHTVGLLFLGWLQNRPPDRLEAYCYHIGEESDHVTSQYQHAATVFRRLPAKLRPVAKQILEDALDVLVYLDIGMHPLPRMLASLRLAPVQCATWGHPLTTGLGSVDYFLSAESMEPEQAQCHYTEKLITLPKIGVCYQQPLIPKPLLLASRSDFGLREDAPVFFCGQSLFKFLPRQDHVLALIAQAAPLAQFVFVTDNDLLAERFFERLRIAFRLRGLDPASHCRILPYQNQFSYWNLNVVSDVFLDTFGWSGGRTALEAIACGLPVVTLPGAFMRGRHSYGILTTLGVQETIASSEDDYVRLAVKLATDKIYRSEILARMQSSFHKLYGDTECLEVFYEFLASLPNSAHPSTDLTSLPGANGFRRNSA